MSTIHYSEMIKDMDLCTRGESSKTFKMKLIKCDETRRTGGEIVSIDKAQKCGLPYHCNDHEMRGYFNMESRKIKAFHLRLVVEYNGLIVYW